jgi:hypothetical protein
VTATKWHAAKCPPQREKKVPRRGDTATRRDFGFAPKENAHAMVLPSTHRSQQQVGGLRDAP